MSLNRRDFLKLGGVALAALLLPPSCTGPKESISPQDSEHDRLIFQALEDELQHPNKDLLYEGTIQIGKVNLIVYSESGLYGLDALRADIIAFSELAQTYAKQAGITFGDLSDPHLASRVLHLGIFDVSPSVVIYGRHGPTIQQTIDTGSEWVTVLKGDAIELQDQQDRQNTGSTYLHFQGITRTPLVNGHNTFMLCSTGIPSEAGVYTESYFFHRPGDPSSVLTGQDPIPLSYSQKLRCVFAHEFFHFLAHSFSGDNPLPDEEILAKNFGHLVASRLTGRG